jgi:phosphatidylinositol glycan class B
MALLHNPGVANPVWYHFSFCRPCLAVCMKGAYGMGAQKLATVTLVTVCIYSCAGHKEWRFIHPILPILHSLTSKNMVDSYFAHAAPPRTAGNAHAGSKSNQARKSTRLPVRNVHFYAIVAALPLFFYIMRYHGQGQIAVMYRLRDIPSTQLHSVGFLMPCHSTPWQAYLHRPELDGGRLWSLGCEPPLE